MNRSKEKIYQIALSLTQGIGAVLFKQLISRFGSASGVFQQKIQNLCQTPGIGEELARNIYAKQKFAEAEIILEKHAKKNVQMLCCADENYPKRLKHVLNAPSILYCSNKINFNVSKVISIVGTRQITGAGREFVKQFIQDLQVYDVTIVSGLAYGVDICAHQEALENGLPTLGVIAGGLDAIYPSEHTSIARQMAKERGGIISEYVMGTKLNPCHFPVRNRIIAGISDATIVVEAGKKSGSIITAIWANQYNKEVFAVPGNVGSKYSVGCNALIKKHQAHLITGASDLAYIMNWEDRLHARTQDRHRVLNLKGLTREEKTAVQILGQFNDVVDMEKLSEESKISMTTLSFLMMQLELKNLIEIMPGNRYRLRVA